MPQIDSVTFSSQIFWLIISFLYNYIFLLTFLLPIIGSILKFREKEFKMFINNSAFFYSIIFFLTNNNNLQIYADVVNKEIFYVKNIGFNILKLNMSLGTLTHLLVKLQYVTVGNKLETANLL